MLHLEVQGRSHTGEEAVEKGCVAEMHVGATVSYAAKEQKITHLRNCKCYANSEIIMVL